MVVWYRLVCGKWCSHVKCSWCAAYTGMQCGTNECIGLICYCGVQVPGVVVPGGKWSLVSSTSPEWSSEVLWSGSRCPVSMLCGIPAVFVVHPIYLCQHLHHHRVICGCFFLGIDFINFCSYTWCIFFSCKVILHEVASFPLIFNVVE